MIRLSTLHQATQDWLEDDPTREIPEVSVVMPCLNEAETLAR
jgi:hypothetical protein